MKKIMTFNSTIILFLLFFLACLTTTKAADLDTVYDVQLVHKCTISGAKEIGGVYFAGDYILASAVDRDSYKLESIDLKACKVVYTNPTAINGTGVDLTFNTSRAILFLVNGFDNVVSYFETNNGALLEKVKTVTSKETYTGIAFAADKKKYYFYQPSINAIVTGDRVGGETKKVFDVFKESNNNKQFKIEGIEYGTVDNVHNIYVVANENGGKNTYILVYDADSASYKYTIHVPGDKSPGVIKGITVRDNIMYLAFNNGSGNKKSNEFYQLDNLAYYEQDYGNKIIDVNLVSSNQVTIIEGSPFDYTGLSVEITHRNGTKENVPLNANNSTISGFNSHAIGKQIVSLSYRGYSFNIEVNVVGGAVPVTGVSISRSKIKIKVGTEKKITATITPKDATNKKVTWASGDPNIVTVSEIGTLRGINPGVTIVSVYTADGNKSASIEVTVVNEDVPEDTGEEPIVKLEVREPVVITKYGDFDFSDLIITITHDDGREETIELDENNARVEGFDNEKVGTQTVTIIFESYSFQIDITVKGLEERPEDDTKNIEPKTLNVIATKEKSNVGLVSLIVTISIISVGVLSYVLIRQVILKIK